MGMRRQNFDMRSCQLVGSISSSHFQFYLWTASTCTTVLNFSKIAACVFCPQWDNWKSWTKPTACYNRSRKDGILQGHAHKIVRFPSLDRSDILPNRKKFNVDTKQAKYSIKYKYEVSSCVLNLHNFVSLRATGNKTFYWVFEFYFKWNRCQNMMLTNFTDKFLLPHDMEFLTRSQYILLQ